MGKYLIKNGKVYQNGAFAPKDIEITDGKITKIADTIEQVGDIECIDAANKYIAPGFVDVHVHLREPGFEHKETIETGSMAAAAGGFTTICAMPNTNPVMDSAETVTAFYQQVEKTAHVHVKTYAAITKALRSEELVDFVALKAAGAFAFTNDGVGVQTANVMYQAMKACSSLDMPLVAHCEDDSLIWGGALHDGVMSRKLDVPGIPSICESVQIARDVLLAEATNCHYHVCHVSTKESVRVIRDAKKAGIHVTAEVSPHHLLLCDEDIPAVDTAFKMNPPLRSKTDKEALIAGLLDGTLDCIATDHAPHHADEKQQDILTAPFGIIGSEHAFSLLYTTFVETGSWTVEQLIDWLTVKPSAIFGLETGVIAENSVADLVLLDLEQTATIQAPFYSKSGNTPFIGKKIKGLPVLTLVSGNIAFKR